MSASLVFTTIKTINFIVKIYQFTDDYLRIISHFNPFYANYRYMNIYYQY